jgi:hypothetical protein
MATVARWILQLRADLSKRALLPSHRGRSEVPARNSWWVLGASPLSQSALACVLSYLYDESARERRYSRLPYRRHGLIHAHSFRVRR